MKTEVLVFRFEQQHCQKSVVIGVLLMVNRNKQIFSSDSNLSNAFVTDKFTLSLANDFIYEFAYMTVTQVTAVKTFGLSRPLIYFATKVADTAMSTFLPSLFLTLHIALCPHFSPRFFSPLRVTLNIPLSSYKALYVSEVCICSKLLPLGNIN